MILKTMNLGQIGTNCYILVDEDTQECAIIDPADQGEIIASVIQREKWTPDSILLTHGHFDHIMGIRGLRKIWPQLPIYCHQDDVDRECDDLFLGMYVPTVQEYGGVVRYGEGGQVFVGNLVLTVLETPGHTPGSVTLRLEDPPVLFTGDTLFRDSMGRTDLPGGDQEEIMKSLRRLGNLEGDFKIYPGHNSSTTLERERRSNFCLRQAMGRL